MPSLPPIKWGASLIYPLQRPFFVWGPLAGVAAGCIFGSWIAGLAILGLFVNTGLLWRRNETAILAFCLGYQWLFATLGYLVLKWTGSYPGDETPGQIETAVLLSVLGLFCLAVGIRIGLWLFKAIGHRDRLVVGSLVDPDYDLMRLFAIAFAANVTGLIWRVSPMHVWFGGAQILYRLIEWKLVFAVLLWLSVFRQRRGFIQAIVLVLLLLVSSLGSTMSGFSIGMMLFFVTLLREWRPWLNDAGGRARNRQIAAIAGAVSVAALAMGLIWEGGVKSAWRSRVLDEQGELVEKADVASFVETLREQTPNWRLQEASESLAARMSSDLLYFSYVLNRVPSIVPHEDGALTKRALMHVAVPRFLDPDKLNLGADSWLVVRYAGIDVASEEQGTSIGLGYIAEFYIDFGVPLMFLPLIVYGMIVALGYASLRLVSPSHSIWMSAATVMCFGSCTSYGGEIAKLLGAFLLSVMIYGLILVLLGRPLHQWLLGPQLPAEQSSMRTKLTDASPKGG